MIQFGLRYTTACAAVAVLVLSVGGCPRPQGPDAELREILAAFGVHSLEKPVVEPAKVALGQALFFDRILGGNLDISCADCHHPALFMGDGLSLSIGQGGTGFGTERMAPLDDDGNPIFIPRNAPEVFNRGFLRTMFWDGRVERLGDGSLATPAGEDLPPGLDGPLAAQAMFPVTSREEMRGFPGDNELAAIDDGDLAGIWAGLMERLLDIEAYRELFAEAYPEVAEEDLTFAHAANAMAAFQIGHFTLLDSPFDRFLRGDNSALTERQKAGLRLFFDRGRCGECHQGPLLTDESFRNVGVVQIGPGRGEGPDGHWDFGRESVTGNALERWAFRTPPLRNVAATGPYMHDGAIATLEGVVRHYDDIDEAARNYDPTQIDPELRDLVRTGQTDAILGRLDPALRELGLGSEEVDDLVAFLESLTDPRIFALGFTSVPEEVPSGLPVPGRSKLDMGGTIH